MVREPSAHLVRYMQTNLVTLIALSTWCLVTKKNNGQINLVCQSRLPEIRELPPGYGDNVGIKNAFTTYFYGELVVVF